MKEIDEVQVLLDAGATFATEEDLSSGTATDRKVLPYQSYTTKADWLRSEIEKIVLPTSPDVLIPNEGPIEHALREGEYHALTSIITRYKEELLELEKGV